jgi:hypothetical protein
MAFYLYVIYLPVLPPCYVLLVDTGHVSLPLRPQAVAHKLLKKL